MEKPDPQNSASSSNNDQLLFGQQADEEEMELMIKEEARDKVDSLPPSHSRPSKILDKSKPKQNVESIRFDSKGRPLELNFEESKLIVRIEL